MRKFATVVLLVTLVAQVATGSRLVHFCPTAIATVAEAASALDSLHDDDHGHVHFGPGGHHHDHCHVHTKKRSSAAAKLPPSRGGAGSAVPTRADAGSSQSENARAPESQTPDRHDCAILSVGKLANATPVVVVENSLDIDADFSLRHPGVTGWYVTVDEVTCAQWPRPPTPDLSPPRTLERLASLCRFLL